MLDCNNNIPFTSDILFFGLRFWDNGISIIKLYENMGMGNFSNNDLWKKS